MSDEIDVLKQKLIEVHGENLKSVVVYGSAVVEGLDDDRPKKVLVVLDQIAPGDLRVAHDVAEWWRSEGNPVPVYFTSEEMSDSSDVFPIEFIDMSEVRRVLFGGDPFDSLEVQTQNLRHQLEYELRAKLLRLRRLYIPVSENANQLARLMAESLDSFAVLFRHILLMMGKPGPFNKRDCVNSLAEALQLDKRVLDRIYQYEADEEVWIESETNETFAKYLVQIDKVIDEVDERMNA